MKIAVIGLGESKAKVPWNDTSWTLWGMPSDPEHWLHYDELFEIHDRSEWERGAYIDRLREIEKPIYMQKRHSDIPCSTAYPLGRAIEAFGDYLASTPAYMLAFAILRGPTEIGVWGVDLLTQKDQYAHQQANLEYLLGYARGRGIRLTIPEESVLLKFDKRYDYPERYGWR